MEESPKCLVPYLPPKGKSIPSFLALKPRAIILPPHEEETLLPPYYLHLSLPLPRTLYPVQGCQPFSEPFPAPSPYSLWFCLPHRCRQHRGEGGNILSGSILLSSLVTSIMERNRMNSILWPLRYSKIKEGWTSTLLSMVVSASSSSERCCFYINRSKTVETGLKGSGPDTENSATSLLLWVGSLFSPIVAPPITCTLLPWLPHTWGFTQSFTLFPEVPPGSHHHPYPIHHTRQGEKQCFFFSQMFQPGNQN